MATKAPKRQASGQQKPETGQVRIQHVAVDYAKPAPENKLLYQEIREDDPATIDLANSLIHDGFLEPPVITRDGYILSGHRRHVAAKVAKLKTIPVRIKDISRAEEPEQFLRLLRRFNLQREKTRDERLREEVLDIDPKEARGRLLSYREERAAVEVAPLLMGRWRRRPIISPAKQPLLAAIIAILLAMKKFWPLSVRQIHYQLLNDPPLRHASKPDSRYANTLKSYKDLDDVATRARITGDIAMESIDDETRPVTTYNTHATTGAFIGTELHWFLKGYERDLQQSQTNHYELLVEKNTVAPILRPVAKKFCIPMTSGRGFCSVPPRYAMAERYHTSGKDKLVLLIVSDFDPEGESIAESFSRSMRDDFDISDIHPIKVALTAEQVEKYKPPSELKAKKSSSRYKDFVSKHGDRAYEVEALKAEQLQAIVEEAIDSVLDIEAFNSEVFEEERDAAFLEGVREQVKGALQGLDLGGAE
ncbi:MAG: ParB N-terminal domain-containing protein [Planctomycetes bacterium]|nr:ParB N-terminal domain-containing protein [Planctomycetota bacterium]